MSQEEEDEDIREDLLQKCNVTAKPFLDIFSEELYNAQLQKHERRLTHKAMQVSKYSVTQIMINHNLYS